MNLGAVPTSLIADREHRRTPQGLEDIRLGNSELHTLHTADSLNCCTLQLEGVLSNTETAGVRVHTTDPQKDMLQVHGLVK